MHGITCFVTGSWDARTTDARAVRSVCGQATKTNKTTKREDGRDEMGANAEVHEDEDADGVTGGRLRMVRVSRQYQDQEQA